NCRGAIDRSGGVRPKLLQHRQPPGRRAHRFPRRTGNWLCAVLPARWFYTAAIRNVVERRRSFKCQADERRISVAASTFAEHSAHSRNIITGTPEREWRANGMSDMAGKAAVEPSGSERDT